MPALAIDCGPFDRHAAVQGQTTPVLKEIFSPILYAVPRRRRNVEQRRMRRFTNVWFDQTKLKKDIIVCLHCGHYHEASTICGNCYEQVREETEKMRSTMESETYKFDHPRSEVVYLYNDELDQKDTHKGKFIVEMKDNRPAWYQKKLLSKTGSKS